MFVGAAEKRRLHAGFDEPASAPLSGWFKEPT
jgi:hypothetical protein